MPYVGQKPADIISTAVDTVTGTFSGEVDAASLDISGNIDVDGTTNLDVVDIDGAVDMASTLGVTGKITADAGIDIDNINIDGTTIALSSGDLTLDVAGDISLDADGGDILLKDGGTQFGTLAAETGGLGISSAIVQDSDIIFKGNDGGATITALTLDMSAAGQANFNAGLGIGGTGAANTLSDYEEGSFTPTWSGYGTDKINSTTGKFVKVGNQVTVYASLVTGTGNDASSVAISNLPFTISGNLGSGTLYHNTAGLRDMHIVTALDSNSTTCRLHGVLSGSDTTIKYVGTDPALGGSSTLIWILFYQTI